jgi:hypothetical protein
VGLPGRPQAGGIGSGIDEKGGAVIVARRPQVGLAGADAVAAPRGGLGEGAGFIAGARERLIGALSIAVGSLPGEGE